MIDELRTFAVPEAAGQPHQAASRSRVSSFRDRERLLLGESPAVTGRP